MRDLCCHTQATGQKQSLPLGACRPTTGLPAASSTPSSRHESALGDVGSHRNCKRLAWRRCVDRRLVSEFNLGRVIGHACDLTRRGNERSTVPDSHHDRTSLSMEAQLTLEVA